jgi:hypothetical protein
MMKDVSLRGVNDVSNELIVNKIQDFAWDDTLSQYAVHPKVLVRIENLWVCRFYIVELKNVDAITHYLR